MGRITFGTTPLTTGWGVNNGFANVSTTYACSLPLDSSGKGLGRNVLARNRAGLPYCFANGLRGSPWRRRYTTTTTTATSSVTMMTAIATATPPLPEEEDDEDGIPTSVHVRASSPTAGAGPLQLIHSGATTHTGTLSLLGVPLIPWFAWNDEQARHVLLLKA